MAAIIVIPGSRILSSMVKASLCKAGLPSNPVPNQRKAPFIL
jgi:hypothetical protein